MGIKYECSHCEHEMDSEIDGATVIHNEYKDDEVVCDDCMNEMADRVREVYEYEDMIKESK